MGMKTAGYISELTFKQVKIGLPLSVRLHILPIYMICVPYHGFTAGLNHRLVPHSTVERDWVNTMDRLYKAGHWARYVTQSATYVAAVVGHDMLRSQPRMSLL